MRLRSIISSSSSPFGQGCQAALRMPHFIFVHLVTLVNPVPQLQMIDAAHISWYTATNVLSSSQTHRHGERSSSPANPEGWTVAWIVNGWPKQNPYGGRTTLLNTITQSKVSQNRTEVVPSDPRRNHWASLLLHDINYSVFSHIDFLGLRTKYIKVDKQQIRQFVVKCCYHCSWPWINNMDLLHFIWINNMAT